MKKNSMKKRMNLFSKPCTLLWFLLAGISSLNAQDLPVVTVTGGYDNYSGFGMSGGLEFSHGAGEPFSGYGRMMASLNALKLMEDVRCVDKGFENTTSHSSEIDRWVAAEAVYRRVSSGRTLFEKLSGADPTPKGTNFLTVTYADGGTENWWIVAPQFSTALSPSPVPGSLKQGSGVAQPHPVCRKS